MTVAFLSTQTHSECALNVNRSSVPTVDNVTIEQVDACIFSVKCLKASNVPWWTVITQEPITQRFFFFPEGFDLQSYRKQYCSFRGWEAGRTLAEIQNLRLQTNSWTAVPATQEQNKLLAKRSNPRCVPTSCPAFPGEALESVWCLQKFHVKPRPYICNMSER